MYSSLILILMALFLRVSVVQAANTLLSAEQVENLGTVAVAKGDTLQINGIGVQPLLDPTRIQFGGGVLILRNVRLESPKGMQISEFSLTVYAGQELHLENVWVEGNNTTIRCLGGRLRIVDSTMASISRGLVISDPGSDVLVTGSNFCRGVSGIEHYAGALELRNCLFLTTVVAIWCYHPEGLEISDCSFQGNGRSIELLGIGPLLVNHCDFYGSRHWYFNNAEGGTITLQNCHLDDGSPTSSGTVIEIDPQDQPWVPRQQPLLSQKVESGGDQIILTFLLSRTAAGLPYMPSVYQVELSNDPNDFSHATIITVWSSMFRIPLDTQEHFFRSRAYIGEW